MLTGAGDEIDGQAVYFVNKLTVPLCAAVVEFKAKRLLTKKPARGLAFLLTGAGDEIRTHDPNLGKVMLYP